MKTIYARKTFLLKLVVVLLLAVLVFCWHSYQLQDYNNPLSFTQLQHTQLPKLANSFRVDDPGSVKLAHSSRVDNPGSVKSTPSNKLALRVPSRHTTPLITDSLRCSKNLDVVIVVSSHAWRGFARRALVRETWGRRNGHFDAGVEQTWQTFFVVGSKTDDPVQKKKLANEHELYQDLVEGNFKEEFLNLPYKLQAMFEWVTLYCNSTYVVKSDDDVWINRKALFRAFLTLPSKGLFGGNLCVNYRPFRNVGSKYYVSPQEWANATYPPFINGLAIMFTPDVVKKLVDAFPKHKVFKLDDVYIGMLMGKIGVKITHVPGFLSPWETDQQCTINLDALVRHDYHGDRRWCLLKHYVLGK